MSEDCRHLSRLLIHPLGTVEIDREAPDRAHLVVKPCPGMFSPQTSWTTAYPDDLIELILEVKGPAWLVDEIMRDESRKYVWRALYYGMFSFVPKEEFTGARLLDFGCGEGAATSILARELPETGFVGVDLEGNRLSIAQARASHYGFGDRAEFLVSPDPESLPPGIGQFDFVCFSAVFEHLLPNEREPLLRLVWSALKPGGVMFINQSPNRHSIIEYHTTSGLPFLNYLPDRVAHRFARRVSKRGLQDMSWEQLLRAGIRGTSKLEVRRLLRSEVGNRFEFLRPKFEGVHESVELWYRSTSILDRKTELLKRVIKLAARVAGPLQYLILPTVIMAIRKDA